MRRHCAHCGSDKFGLVRHRLGALQFCKRKCKEAWQAQYERHVAAQKRCTSYRITLALVLSSAAARAQNEDTCDLPSPSAAGGDAQGRRRSSIRSPSQARKCVCPTGAGTPLAPTSSPTIGHKAQVWACPCPRSCGLAR